MKSTFLTLLFFVFVSIANAKPIIAIDAGHEPSQPGALGSCQKTEVDYNDAIVQEIVNVLSPSYQIILTRSQGVDVNTDDSDLINYLPEQEKSGWKNKKSLFGRAALANKNKAQIFIAIHHDSTTSAQQIHDPSLCNKRGGTNLKSDFKNKYAIGYNIFIDDHDKTIKRKNTLLLAENVGKQLRKMGRIPSNYHVYPDDSCQSCYPINKQLGIWNENLAVLRSTNMPAILIEVGNIVSPEDEKIIATKTFKHQFSLALKKAIDQYFVVKPVSQ